VSYIGYIDSIRGRMIRGWAFNGAAPGERVALRILADGEPIGEARAELFRSDLKHSGIGDGAHGFEFALSENQAAASAFVVEVAGAGFRLVDTTLRQRKRADEAFFHSHFDGLPALRYGFSASAPGEIDRDIASRMRAIWKRLAGEGASRFVGSGNMWEIHGDAKQRDFIALLAGDDDAALAAYCTGLPKHAVTHGLFQGDEHYRTLAAATPAQLNAEASRYWDHAVALAEYLGVARVECPEQGEWGRALFADMGLTRVAIEQALGTGLLPPQAFEGLFGLAYDDGVLHRRDIHACYAAHRLSQLSAQHPGPIVEIGGGMGGVAWYANRLGLRDFTIVDLPVVSLLQYWFLAKSLGPECVRFVLSPEDFRHDDRVQLVPASLFGEAAIGGFGLAFNMDSFPEMGSAVAGEYLRAFAAKGVPALFSVNQEAKAPLTTDPNGPRQAWVREVALEAGWQPRLRYPDWVHKGYVDELFGAPPARS
jgi:hypothetical protein